jgi:recombination protein RecT
MSLPARITDVVDGMKLDFEQRIAAASPVQYAQEAHFALQQLAANSYLLGIAQNNPDSLRAAMLNVAATGLSLNPVKKQAYLIPRNKAVVLDISYMGILHVAQMSGAIEWGQARIVRAGHTFRLTGINQAPVHEYNPFENDDAAGAIVGAYCVVKLPSGDFLTHCLNMDALLRIRSRSESFKSGKNSPWLTDPEPMMKKSAVRGLAPYMPYREAMAQAMTVAVEAEAEQAHDGEQPEPPPPALPEYTDAQMAENLPKWQAAINSGRTTPERIIALVSSKYALTTGQETHILNMEKQGD